jgi:hypothetical protein
VLPTRIAFLVLVEHAPNVVRVIEEVDARTNARWEHIPILLARPELITERIARTPLSSHMGAESIE